MKNYIKLQKRSLFYNYYIFVDTKDYLADGLFIKNKVYVHFGKEYTKQNCDYIIIFCKVRKKDEERFLHALKQLENKMLLLEQFYYPEFCRTLLKGKE